MIDINLIRENPDLVRENIKKKFQDKKLPLVDEVLALDAEKRATWSFSPVTRKVENKKHYDRKKSAHVWKDDFGMGAFCLS